jgi:hypothetical protein
MSVSPFVNPILWMGEREADKTAITAWRTASVLADRRISEP